MLIDYVQNKHSIELSYVDGDSIVVEDITPEGGYFKFVECDKFDDGVEPSLRSFNGSYIRKDHANRFSDHEVNYFLDVTLRTEFPQLYGKINTTNIPKVYSVDIETDIDPVKGYAPPTDPFNPVRSISITDPTLNTILFIIKNPEHPEITDVDNAIIIETIKQQLAETGASLDNVQFRIKQFDSEIEMLSAFLNCINKYFHLIIGWNFLEFDWQYIFNRCKKLNININKASPTNKIYKKQFLMGSEMVKLTLPNHRLIVDYMLLFKGSNVYSDFESYSLNNVSEHLLGTTKVSYQGNLKMLYDTDYLRFISYAFVDTLLVMLLHKKSNLLGVEFFQSYYTKVAFQKLSQTSITEAIMYFDLMEKNKFLIESEHMTSEIKSIAGGFVKNPTKKHVDCTIGLDFNSLYPSIIISMGISPESIVDTIDVDESGYPSNDNALSKWLSYKNSTAGVYTLTPSGNIYDITTDTLYPRIAKKLLSERKIFKGYMANIYSKIQPAIEAEMKKRNLIYKK
jgi:DNA polymerase elongation subunit (family B)